MIARPYPAAPMMSSRPYGPPETIKYVAATSGTKRSLLARAFSATVCTVPPTVSGLSFVPLAQVQTQIYAMEPNGAEVGAIISEAKQDPCGELAEWLKAAVC